MQVVSFPSYSNGHVEQVSFQNSEFIEVHWTCFVLTTTFEGNPGIECKKKSEASQEENYCSCASIANQSYSHQSHLISE